MRAYEESGRRPTAEPSPTRSQRDSRGLMPVRCGVVSIEQLPIEVVRLDPDLDLPVYAHPGDAGLDLRARTDGVVAAGGGRLLMPTGIALAIPQGWAGLVHPRSGLALKHGVTVANAPGLIDSAYRGELQVILLNTDPTTDYRVARGDRIAQLVVQRVAEVTWRQVDELDGKNRGGGFGHTGR
jgi:dUTP pyrophosphatase